MANKKDPKKLKNNASGQSSTSFSTGSLNEILNKKTGGYGGASRPKTTTPTNSSKKGNYTSPFKNTPNPFEKSASSTKKTIAQKPVKNIANAFANKMPEPTNPFANSATSEEKVDAKNIFSNNPFLSSLQQPTGKTNVFGMPASTQNATQKSQPILTSYKTPRQLRKELEERKKASQKASPADNKQKQDQLKAQLKELEKQQDALSGTNAFGTGAKGEISSNLGDLFGNNAKPDTAKGSKILPANEFFKQLKEFSKTSVSTNPEDLKNLSDEEYVDERKQQILDQLERLQGIPKEEEEEEKKRRGGWFWIILLTSILLVLSVAGVFLYSVFIPDDYEYVRISVEMTDPDDVFYYTGINGEKIPVLVDPGDSFDLEIIARNASNVLGDTDSPVWESIFVRFRIWITIDGVEQYHFIEIAPNENLWMHYEEEVENTYLDNFGNPLVSEDDGYYYYKGKLQPNQQTTLITELTFSLDAITDQVAGKKAQLYVQVEVLEDSYGIGTYWTGAPYAWIDYIQTNAV